MLCSDRFHTDMFRTRYVTERYKMSGPLASAVTPTAQYGHQKLMSFSGNSLKSGQNGEKLIKKDVKKSKNCPFLSDRFQ
jgi:hypothetical protein